MRKVSIFTLLDDEGRILLQHRSPDSPRFPDIWAFFGGGIEEGETPEEALERECREELAYDIEEYEFYSKFYRDANPEVEKWFFVAPLKCDFEDLELREGDDFGMFTLKEAKNLDMSEDDREILEDLEENFIS